MSELTSEKLRLQQSFPNLAGTEYHITSPEDRAYNCIAWAAGDMKHFWWPFPPPYAYWPPGAPLVPTLSAFVAAFATLGYAPCDSAEYETGYEKVALFLDAQGVPLHAARQVADGRWTSKLGRSFDIEHVLDGLAGTKYGTVGAVLCRRMRS